MSRLALACAAMLASLFTVTAQADAGGFKRYKPHGIHQHHVHKHKVHNVRKYRAQKRLRAMHRFQKRYVLKRHRHHKPYRFARRYR